MMQASPGDNEIMQTLLPGFQGGGFLEKSPPGRRRQKCISWQAPNITTVFYLDL
jgi:hypothetical protein